MNDYRLAISNHIHAPRLARVFIRGVIEELDISDEARTAVVLMVSDAASDSVRSGNDVTVTGNRLEDGCVVTVEGSEMAPPTVTSMPSGLTVAADGRLLEIRIGV